MPKSDPEARSKTSANSKDATTSVRTFIPSARVWLSDKLQFVDSLKRLTIEDDDKLKLVGHYRSFKVVRLSKANNMARIKKRKTIFDSFHPTISKW